MLDNAHWDVFHKIYLLINLLSITLLGLKLVLWFFKDSSVNGTVYFTVMVCLVFRSKNHYTNYLNDSRKQSKWHLATGEMEGFKRLVRACCKWQAKWQIRHDWAGKVGQNFLYFIFNYLFQCKFNLLSRNIII
jgi:hypothetical protein